MSRQRLNPNGFADRRPILPITRIYHHPSVRVATNEIAPAHDVEGGRPGMRVKGRPFTGRNPRIEHSDPLVLEKDFVMVWRSEHCI